MMTGDYIPAPEAEEMGLINDAVPADQLDERVNTVARKLADGPQQAITYTKKSLNTWLEFGVNLTLRESMALELLTQQQEDHAAALDAFLQGESVEFPSATGDQ
jgi:enoyl-CoA hydratase